MRLGVYKNNHRIAFGNPQLVGLECHALVLHPCETTSPTSLVWVIRVMISEPSPHPIWFRGGLIGLDLGVGLVKLYVVNLTIVVNINAILIIYITHSRVVFTKLVFDLIMAVVIFIAYIYIIK